MNSLFLEVLKYDPRDIDLSDIPHTVGDYSGKCRICNSEYRKLIDYLLFYVSTRKIAAYVNKYQLFDSRINHQSIYSHKWRHINTDIRPF